MGASRGVGDGRWLLSLCVREQAGTECPADEGGSEENAGSDEGYDKT